MNSDKIRDIVTSMRRDLEWGKAKLHPGPNRGEIRYVEEFSEANERTLRDIEKYVCKLEDALGLPHDLSEHPSAPRRAT